MVTLDKGTNRIATPSCPDDYTVAFIAGTEPRETCEQGFGDHRGFFTKIFGLGPPPVAAPPPNTNGAPPPGMGAPGQPAGGGVAQSQPPQQKKKKHGFFSRLFGRGDHGDEQQNNGTGSAENGNNTNPH